MTALFDNLVWNATLACAQEDSNYPVENLNHEFLTKIFKATGTSAEITIDLSSAAEVNCCYLAFTNATSATLSLYDAGDNLLGTETLIIARNGNIFSQTYEDVDYCGLVISGSATVYLGTVHLGKRFTFPYPDANIAPQFVDNSGYYVSDFGQAMRNKIPFLIQLRPKFFCDDISELNQIIGLLDANERNIFFDLYEGTDGAVKVIYSTVKIDGEIKQEGLAYRVSMTVTEAR